ncbi:hypothetical protein CVT24_008087 [Panaeolus cyanescens]|uniref:HAMP domain-containing protein n=1 Tax=Panaeolus cyanescens TaxID=181874 RepID=A0A409W0L2_9AGAR|nr:hypothetical protein CVT24_008087 [Panaeolus cyanescens]
MTRTSSSSPDHVAPLLQFILNLLSSNRSCPDPEKQVDPKLPTSLEETLNEHEKSLMDNVIKEIKEVGVRECTCVAEDRPIIPIPGLFDDGELLSRKAPQQKPKENDAIQLGDISSICRAVSRGDFGQKSATLSTEEEVEVDLRQLRDDVHVMADTVYRYIKEVSRVTQDIVEGNLGTQITIPAEGEWSQLISWTNAMSFTIANHVRSVSEVTKAITFGDFSKRARFEAPMRSSRKGLDLRGASGSQLEGQGGGGGELRDLLETVNFLAGWLDGYVYEMTEAVSLKGISGNVGACVVDGQWKRLRDDVNTFLYNVITELRCIAVSATGVARGDLSQKIHGLDVSGEMLEVLHVVNDMVDILKEFTEHVQKAVLESGIDRGTALMNAYQWQAGGIMGIWSELR